MGAQSPLRRESRQTVVGNREFHPGQKVTQAMADADDRRAHVCPFVLSSIEAHQFFIEQSPLGDASEADIERKLVSQIPDFKNQPPPYDPVPSNQPAPQTHLLKTFLTFFPNVTATRSAGCDLVLRLHARLKAGFMHHGMMIGEFFPYYRSGSIYAGNGYNASTAPYPAFAIRYMAWHDHLFTQDPAYQPLYKAYFP